MESLLDAVEVTIRAGLGYSPDECAVMADGQPPAIGGQVFVAISDGEWRPGPLEEVLDEYFGVTITITMRVADHPRDRLGLALRTARTGLYARAEAIRALLHMSYGVMAAANAILGASVNGFIEPLRWQGANGRARKVGPDWFDADPEGGEDGSDDCGLVLEVGFGTARRVQRFDGPMG